MQKCLGWLRKKTPSLGEEGKLSQEAEKKVPDGIFGHVRTGKLESGVAEQKQSSRRRIVAMILSAVLFPVGILWQTGYLDPLFKGFSKPKVSAVTSESQTVLQQASEVAELQASFVESYRDSTDISEVIDKSIEAMIVVSRQAAVPTPETIGEAVTEGSAQEGDLTQTSEAQTVQRLREGYYVQWGAFSNAINARSMLALLSEQGVEAFVEQYKGLHRVLVGPFSEYKNAKAEGERLRQNTSHSYWIFWAGPER